MIKPPGQVLPTKGALMKAYEKLFERYKALGEEKAALLEALDKLVTDLRDLMNASEGVAGLHRNGDVATWDELTRGGKISSWLSTFDDACELLSALNLPDETQDAPPRG